MTAIATFAVYAKAKGFSPDNILTMCGHLNKVTALFDPDSKDNLAAKVLQGIRRDAPKHSRRYNTIWELDMLLGWLRENWTDNAALGDGDLQTKAMMLTMIFSACRLAELARMETPDESALEGKSLWLHTITKQHHSSKETVVLQEVADQVLCPVRTVRSWLGRRRKYGNGTLFVALPKVQAAGGQTWGDRTHQDAAPAENTSRSLRSPEIAAAFVMVMRKAGIDSSYTAYSIKHAVITKLFRAGAPEEQVVEFGRWARNSNTPKKWYNIQTLETEWLGAQLLAGSMSIPRGKAIEGFDAGYLPPTRSAEEAQVRAGAQHWILNPLPESHSAKSTAPQLKAALSRASAQGGHGQDRKDDP
jgi:hypothetical protein